MRFVFNSWRKKENETVDKYVTALRTLAQTCNFCTCLRNSLICDVLVIGIKEKATQKKLLQDRKLALCRAIDLCRSNETTGSRSRNFTKPAKKPSSPLKPTETKLETAKPKFNVNIAAEHIREKKEFCPAFGSRCRNCGRNNHFGKVCLRKAKNPWQKPLHSAAEDDSNDSGDSVLRDELSPTGNESVLAVQEIDSYQSRLFTAVEIKGGNNKIPNRYWSNLQRPQRK